MEPLPSAKNGTVDGSLAAMHVINTAFSIVIFIYPLYMHLMEIRPIRRFINMYFQMFTPFVVEVVEIVRQIHPMLFGEEEDLYVDEKEEEKLSFEDQSDFSSDEAIAEEYIVGDDWDLGSSQDTDEYLTELEDEENDKAKDDEVAQVTIGAMRTYASFQRDAGQSLIANTIRADEFLLANGMIDASQFGETIMVEI